MAETKKLLRYWEDGVSVDIIQKESAANEEASDDNEVSDSNDDNHMSCEDLIMMIQMYLEIWFIHHHQ